MRLAWEMMAHEVSIWPGLALLRHGSPYGALADQIRMQLRPERKCRRRAFLSNIGTAVPIC